MGVDKLSVFLCYDTSVQIEIIFGTPNDEKYGKSGSINDDLQWVNVV